MFILQVRPTPRVKHRGKEKQYGTEVLTRAVKAVKSGRVSLRKASKTYGVPYNTLRDYKSGRSVLGKMSGHAKLLTEEEEQALKTYLMYMADHGFGLTRLQMATFAKAILQEANRKVSY